MLMELPTAQVRCTVAEYLRRESDSLEKHEYREGEILSMAGGSADHSLIVANVIREVGNRLKGKSCHVYDSNLRVRIPRKALYTYPDALVICGDRQSDPDDPRGGTITNPRLIVEVLSPSTEAYDRGDKFDRYRELQSLREYVLVSQTEARLEVFYRQPEGMWLFDPVSGINAIAKLRSIEVELALSEVYTGVVLSSRDPGATS